VADSKIEVVRLGDSVVGSIFSRVWGQLLDQAGNLAWCQVLDRVYDGHQDEVYDLVLDQIEEDEIDATWQIKEQIRKQIEDQVGDQVWRLVKGRMVGRIQSQVGSRIWNSTTRNWNLILNRVKITVFDQAKEEIDAD